MNSMLSLKMYIDASITKKVNDRFYVKLSKDLAINYDNGLYNSFTDHINKCISIIDKLGIKYPCNGNPIYYIYIIPLDKTELLNIPKEFSRKKGGGKPVSSFELDGFNSAYGITEDIAEKTDFSFYNTINSVHELTHLVASMFFSKDRFISEGIAEAVPFYVLDMEEEYLEHKDIITSLEEKDILSVKELIMECKNNEFGSKSVNYRQACSFRYSYISSYILCASIIDRIKDKYSINKKEALQKLFEFLRSSKCYQEFLIYEIASFIDVDAKELLEGKKIQLEFINKLKG